MKIVASRRVKGIEPFVHYLLKNGVNVKIACLRWRTPTREWNSGTVHSTDASDNVHYIQLDAGSYALLEFAGCGAGGYHAAIHAEEGDSSGNGLEAAVRLFAAYRDAAGGLDPLGRADLLVLEAKWHTMMRSSDAHERAFELASEALRLHPGHARAWNTVGVVHSLRGRNREALEQYLQAVSLDPRLLRAWVNIGNRYGSLGSEERSLFAYRIALRLAPELEGDTPMLQSARESLACDAAVDLEAALLAWNRMTREDLFADGNEPAEPLYEQAVRSEYRRSWKRALSMLFGAFSSEPGNARIVSAVSYAYRFLGRHHEAGRFDARLLALARGAEGAGMRASALVRMNRVAEAVAVYEEALRGGARPPCVLLARALLLDRSGGAGLARTAFLEFLDAADKASGNEASEDTLYAGRRIQEAVFWDDGEGAGATAEPHFAESRRFCILEERRDHLRGCMKARPAENAESLIMEAEDLMNLDRDAGGKALCRADARERAWRTYRRAARANPGHAGAFYCKALAEDAKGNREEAFRDFCRFMVLTPGNEGEPVRYARRRLQEIAYWRVMDPRSSQRAVSKDRAGENG